MAGGGGTDWDGAARSAERAGSRLRAADNQRRQLFVLVPMLIVFYADMFHILGPGSSRVGGVLAAVAVAFGSLLVRPLLLLLVMPCLGARTVHLRVGVGPFLGFQAAPWRTVSFRAVPITLRGAYLPRPAHYGRDMRISLGIAVLSPLALTAAGALLIPPYARVLCLIVGLGYTGAAAASRRPGSPRTLAARAFRTAAPRVDPQLADPNWGHIANGLMAAQYGDLQAAGTHLEYLRTRGRGSGAMEALIQQVRGDYAPAIEAALRAADTAPKNAEQHAARQATLARLAFHTLLAAERDPGTEARAALIARQALRMRGTVSKLQDATDETLRVRALTALLDGDPDGCLRLARRQLAVSYAPLGYADALCTRARAQAAKADVEGARATLARAARVAPWYARVGIVRGLLGMETVAAQVTPVVTAVGETRLFEDPWSTPEM